MLLGAEASEGALKRAPAPRVVHMATHGFFLADLPAPDEGERGLELGSGGKMVNPLLRSGLALAGANVRRTGGEDGILTAMEVAGLDLWGTKLVVLSACQTGVGEVRTGDGVYGLRRALVLAGSESQVMSLWSVADRATRDLMVAYYARLERGEGRSAALRAVQLRMLRRAATRHPFFWAAFIQSGAWSPIEGT
jgi:CHAT domain-containing protein